MANTKKAPGKEHSTAEVEAAVKEMETQSVKDSTKEAAAGGKDSAKKNTVKKGSMKKAAAYAEETELGANAADKAERIARGFQVNRRRPRLDQRPVMV